MCKEDTVVPYNCNDYHNILAKTYKASYSPYISGFRAYQQKNKTVSNIEFDVSLLNQLELDTQTEKWRDYYTNLGLKVNDINTAITNFNQKYSKGVNATDYAEFYLKALQDRGADFEGNPATVAGAAARLGADIFYIDDAKSCKNITQDRGEGIRGCGASFLNIIPFFKISKLANIAKVTKALEGIEDINEANKIIKALDLGKDTENIIQALEKAGSVKGFIGKGGKVLDGAKPIAKGGLSMANGLADDVAKELGYVKTKGIRSASNAPIYKKIRKMSGPEFISPDTTSHTTNFGWKGAQKAESLTSPSKKLRSGTYTTELKLIND